MAQVIIRNLADRVVAVLKQKAEMHGRSLEQELRQVVTEAARLTPQEKVRLSREIRAMTSGGRSPLNSARLIREDRDSGH